MAAFLALAFVVVPLVELAVIVRVADAVGLGDTLLLLVLLSLVGAWLVRSQGLGVWRRAQRQLQEGRVPGRELVDGLMILLGGALMLTPGFVTDGVGFALLLPPVRAVLRGWFSHRLEARIVVHAPPGTTFGHRSGTVHDVGSRPAPDERGDERGDPPPPLDR